MLALRSSAFGSVGLRTPVSAGGALGLAPIAKKPVEFCVIGDHKQFRVAAEVPPPPRAQ